MSYNIQRKQLQTPLSASYAESASYLIGSVTFNTSSLVTTSSFNAFTSSYTTGSFTGSFRGVFTGSLFGTASNAITASYIPTLRATGSNYEIQFNNNGNLGSTPAFTWLGTYLYLGVGDGAYIGNGNIISANDIGLFDAAGDGVIAAYDPAGVFHYARSQYKYDNNTDTHQFTGSVQVNGSITGSLLGTASQATNAATASYISTLRATGSNTQIQFNNNGLLGADSKFSWDGNRVIIDSGYGSFIGSATILGANDTGLFGHGGDEIIAGFDGNGGFQYSQGTYKYNYFNSIHQFTGSLRLSGSSVLFYLDTGPGLTIKTRAYDDVPFADTFQVTTASEVFIKGPVECTGYLTVFTSSTYPNSAIITPTLYVGSYSTATANTAASLHAGPGFVNITGSLRVNNGGITGSLFGTSSVASKVVIDTTPASTLGYIYFGDGVLSGATSLYSDSVFNFNRTANRLNVPNITATSITASAAISTLLTLTPTHPLPVAPQTGTFMVSASSPPKPYFWDGSVWNPLY